MDAQTKHELFRITIEVVALLGGFVLLMLWLESCRREK